MERWYFDIPIYRCTCEAHSAEMESWRKKYTAGAASHPATLDNANNFWWEHRWRCWDFNDVVAWLRLFMLGGDQVRGDLFLHDKRPMVRGHWKVRWIGKAFERDVPPEASDPEILRLVRDGIQETMESTSLRKRSIDLSRFDAIAPYVGWRLLLASSTSDLG